MRPPDRIGGVVVEPQERTPESRIREIELQRSVNGPRGAVSKPGVSVGLPGHHRFIPLFPDRP
jgi:hypothetical protein